MLAVDNISKSFDGRTVLQAASHEFVVGGTTAVVGPSGCGKTTLLRMLLWLLVPDSGTVTLDGTEVTAANAERLRLKVGYVIQEGGLFPHLTAYENVALMASWIGKPVAQVRSRVDELAALVRIAPDVLARYPGSLSGGQRQRVALMRALMLDPPILLMDEPLGALDPMIRFDLQNELKDIFVSLNKTVVVVTHDMHEAAFFAHEILLMRAGRIVQRGSVDELLSSPADDFVFDFIRAQRADPRLVSS